MLEDFLKEFKKKGGIISEKIEIKKDITSGIGFYKKNNHEIQNGENLCVVPSDLFISEKDTYNFLKSEGKIKDEFIKKYFELLPDLDFFKRNFIILQRDLFDDVKKCFPKTSHHFKIYENLFNSLNIENDDNLLHLKLLFMTRGYYFNNKLYLVPVLDFFNHSISGFDYERDFKSYFIRYEVNNLKQIYCSYKRQTYDNIKLYFKYSIFLKKIESVFIPERTFAFGGTNEICDDNIKFENKINYNSKDLLICNKDELNMNYKNLIKNIVGVKNEKQFLHMVSQIFKYEHLDPEKNNFTRDLRELLMLVRNFLINFRVKTH